MATLDGSRNLSERDLCMQAPTIAA